MKYAICHAAMLPRRLGVSSRKGGIHDFLTRPAQKSGARIEYNGICDRRQQKWPQGCYRMLEYHAAYYKDENGWYVVSLLDFPGVHTQGKDLREARFMVKDALKLMVNCYLDEGLSLPRPNPKAADPEANRIEKVRLEILVREPVPA